MRVDKRRIRTVAWTGRLEDTVGEARQPWHETPGEVREGLRRGRDRAWLLAWVRREMAARLTVRQRECVELHYFEGLTLEAVARRTGTNRSSVFRAVRRGVERLRAAAREDASWRRYW